MPLSTESITNCSIAYRMVTKRPATFVRAELSDALRKHMNITFVESPDGAFYVCPTDLYQLLTSAWFTCPWVRHPLKILPLKNASHRLGMPKAADITNARALATRRGKQLKLNISYGYELINWEISVHFDKIGLVPLLNYREDRF